jgi:hypothetical protein
MTRNPSLGIGQRAKAALHRLLKWVAKGAGNQPACNT